MKPLSKLQKVTAAGLALLVAPFILIALLLYIGAYLSHSELSLNAQDRAFSESLQSALKTSGDTIQATSVHSGKWSMVCPLVTYTRVSELASQELGIARADVVISTGQDELSNDAIWGVVFLTSPNMAEVRQISSADFFQGDSNGCASRERAQFTVQQAQDIQGNPRLRLSLIQEPMVVR